MARRTVKIKKYFDVIIEHEAAGTITPGHLVALNNENKVAVHAADAGRALPMFALEDELQGRGIGTNYTAGEPVQVWVAGRGEEVYAILEANENVSIGDFLVSKGNGKLKKIASDTVADAQVIGVALTASNVNTDARIIVKII